MTPIVPEPLAAIPNIHRDLLQKHFDTLQPVASARPTRFLFVCFTNRCGSTVICQTLASGKALNRAGEYFNATTIINNCRHRGSTSIADYLDWLCGLAVNGWLVAKVTIPQLAVLTEIGWLGAVLPHSHFLHVERADQMGQAISLAIARQNNRWSADQPARIPDDQLRYNRAAITAALGYITHQASLTRLFFATNGLVPISVNYERFIHDPQAGIDEIARAAGIEQLAINTSKVQAKRQSGPVNADWRARYLAGEDI